jgi:hypothetical protein
LTVIDGETEGDLALDGLKDNTNASAKAKRRIRNLLLQPLLQMKLGFYSILFALLFATAVAAILYHNFGGLLNAIVLLTDAEEEVRELLLDYWYGTQVWIYASFTIYLLATVAITVIYTHKLVGPTIAFRRHLVSLASGNYNARTYLRRGDAFKEVADELNRLSEVLEKNAEKDGKKSTPMSL